LYQQGIHSPLQHYHIAILCLLVHLRALGPYFLAHCSHRSRVRVE
jgi:hypothetical protein